MHAAVLQVHVPSLTAVPSVLEQWVQGVSPIDPPPEKWNILYLFASLSTQACPQSVWEKVMAPSNTRRRRGGDQCERKRGGHQ